MPTDLHAVYVRKCSEKTETGGASSIASIWLILYLLIVGAAVTNLDLSTAIELAGLH